MGTLGIIQPSSRLERGGACPKVTQPVSMEPGCVPAAQAIAAALLPLVQVHALVGFLSSPLLP